MRQRGNSTKVKAILTQEILKELLDYNSETGVLYWKERDLKWFNKEHQCTAWNTKYADKVAERITNSKNGPYKVTCIFDANIKTHHVVWMLHNGRWPEQIDHINGNPSDNRIENLRESNATLNNRNQKMQHNNKSGYTGVHWCKMEKRWIAKGHTEKGWRTLKKSKDINVCIEARRKFIEEQGGYSARHGIPPI